MSLPVTPSQTVGPFFGVGLPFEGSENVVPAERDAAIRIQGQVIDGKGDPVPDALLEIWEPSVGFGRCRTDAEGAFHVVAAKPKAGGPGGAPEAPHLNVTVFARGLLRHLVTRIYFPDEATANADDPVLKLVEPERRPTLIAKECGNVLHFDIRLQGTSETVFFVI
ncbi:MAG TPA: protocatechuate 3,4-dioxygenase subunit alpha [Candidatus Dormibacteraeota bacterium]